MRFASSGSASAPRVFERAGECVALLAACALFAAPARGTSLEADAGAPWTEALRSIQLPVGTSLVQSPAAATARDAERSLHDAGYEIAVSIPPNVHIVRATRRAGPLPGGFILRAAGALAPALDGSGAARTARGVAEAPGNGAEAGARDPFGGLGDVPPPGEAGTLSRSRGALRAMGSAPLPSGLFYGTRWEDLSEFMVGRVGLGIYFSESDGTVDLDRYDWTPALRDSVVRSAVRGFLQWSNFAATRNIPLSFHLEIHPSLPTRYEPISRSVSQEDLWIEDMLRPLVGYRGDAFSMAQDVANGVRARLGTQWGGMVIAVQNDSSSTGTFPDGLIAHARLGGPWFVIPVNNARSTSATLDYYMEHEVTHLFWALDEYPANNAWWWCTLTAGYFDVVNWNSSIPFSGYCPSEVRCLMRGNYPDSLCHFTAEQVGWRDIDGSGTIDFFETRPAVLPDSTRYRVGAGFPLLLRGRVGETALPNRNPNRFYAGDSISVSVIDSLFYRVDEGPWISIPPVDGVFDEGEEPFEVTLPPPSIGTHTIEWQAHNTNGRAAALIAKIAVTISGSSGSVDPPGSGSPSALRLVLGPSPGRGSVRFSLSGTRPSGAVVRLWTSAGALARTWQIREGESSTAWTWDGLWSGGERAPSGVYFVTVDSGGERVRRRLVYLR